MDNRMIPSTRVNEPPPLTAQECEAIRARNELVGEYEQANITGGPLDRLLATVAALRAEVAEGEEWEGEIDELRDNLAILTTEIGNATGVHWNVEAEAWYAHEDDEESCDSLRDALREAMRREVAVKTEPLRADAERLGWLDANGGRVQRYDDYNRHAWGAQMTPSGVAFSPTLRDAIDAARAAGGAT